MALINGAEVYANGAAVASGTGGGSGYDSLSNVTISGGSIVADNTHAAHGTLSFKVTGTSGTSAFIGWTGLTGATLAFRVYVWFDALPSIAQTLVQVRGSGGQIANWNLTAANKLQLTDSTATAKATATNAITTGVWYRLEGEVTSLSASTGGATLRYYTLDSTTAIESLSSAAMNTGTSTAFSEIRIGKAGTSTWAGSGWFDDLAVQAGSSAPLGPYVAPVTPPTVVVPADFFRLLSDGSVAITATATPASGGTITGYAWTQVSGPTSALTNANTATVTVAPPATVGAQVFRCTATQTS